MRKILGSCILVLHSFLAIGQHADTLQVYFPLNGAIVSGETRTTIDKTDYRQIVTKGRKLILLGYADYTGSDAYNMALSARRAKSIQAYLISAGLHEHDFMLCAGKGKINRAPVPGQVGYAADRKVQIISLGEPRGPKAPVRVKEAEDTTFSPGTDIAINATYPLNILFENRSSVIEKASYPELMNIYKFLNTHKKIKVQIKGHICCMDPKQDLDGDDISYKGPVLWHRAKAIYDFMVKQGIDSTRLKYIGLGSKEPLVYPEVTDKDQEKNRRVVIRILSK